MRQVPEMAPSFKTNCRLAFATLTLWLNVTLGASAATFVANGGFDNGLANWQRIGDVTSTAGVATLQDATAQFSLLYQPVEVIPGVEYTFTFDFENNLSPFTPPEEAADIFFVALYFTNDLSTFDLLASSYAASLALFDLSAAGPANVFGAIAPSPKGARWLRYTAAFTTPYRYVAPGLELASLNTISGDSQVTLDNVHIIPEPASALLAAAGFSLLLYRRTLRAAMLSRASHEIL